MSKLIRLALLAFAIGLIWNLGPVKAWRDRARSVVQSETDTLVGKGMADIGQDLKRRQVQETLERAIAAYQHMNGADPRTLQDLVSAGLLQKPDLDDEWGRPLELEAGGQGLVVRGLGADGQRGTQDDWTLTH